jgi:Protein of unknown function (DUF3768)
MSNAATIARLNDQFRKNPMRYGRLMLTTGVNAKGQDFVARVLRCIASYENFPHGDDPYGENDFGAFALDGERIFFKVDYFDPTMEVGSEDPSDPTKTVRVMTVMLADEY